MPPENTSAEISKDDRILASAARFLIDGGEEDAASVLLSCSLDVWASGDIWFAGDEVHSALHVKLTGPRAAYEVLSDSSHEIAVQVQRALDAVLPADTYIKHFTVHAELIDIDPDWRIELLEIARGRGIHNQAVREAPRTWRNLRFRSESEIRIAQAFERAEVLFLPNCMARLGPAEDRKNREADFLVCAGGKLGILEVDGEPFHPPSRTVQDHQRDRLFREHGIRMVEHFDASECFEKPDAVVERFLRLLLRS
jgi:hypothetical protein